MTCRICSSATRTLLDLGESPPANSLKQSPDQPEESYPLVLEQCDRCGNVQLRDCVDARALYSQYLYMTPDSPSLTRHYTALEQHLTDRGAVGPEAVVLEIGSNTGMFLRHLQPRVRRVIGVDPAANICRIANASGIETVCDFFDAGSAATLKDRFGHPDLIVARHCFAHNRDPHEMLRGVTTLLDPQGHFLIENAYLLNTIENNEFDQIYHEHMFYYSIRSMQALLARHGMHIVDVLLVPVHGGSIVFLTKKAVPGDRIHAAVEQQTAREDRALTPASFERFAGNTLEIRRQLRATISELIESRQRIYTYGATAKGTTLLNFVGITAAQIPCCVDSTPIKQGRYLPKCNIKVISEEDALRSPPEYFLLTAWNYKDEIIDKVRRAGNTYSRFIVPIPTVTVV